MKKIVLLLIMLFITTGCGSSEESYDYTCKKTDESSEEYKTTTEIKFSFDGGKVYKFTSTVTEEHQNESSVNNAYMQYQNTYDNYNENNIEAEYQKDKLKIIATYILDKSDIDKMKVDLPYDFTLSKDKFVKSLEESDYKCTKK